MTEKVLTVGELINKLQSFDSTLPVYTIDSEYGSEPLLADSIKLVEKESFRRNDSRYPDLRVEL